MANATDLLNTYGINPYAYASATSVLATVDMPIANGEIVAYVNGEARGVCSVTPDYQFITVYGADVEQGREVSFKLMQNGKTINLNGHCTFAGNGAEGTFASPVKLFAAATNVQATFASNNAVDVYPNPFKQHVSINVELAQKAAVSYEVYNAMGQKVYTSTAATYPKGNYQLVWDARNMATGVYTIKATVNGEVTVKKVSKIN